MMYREVKLLDNAFILYFQSETKLLFLLLTDLIMTYVACPACRKGELIQNIDEPIDLLKWISENVEGLCRSLRCDNCGTWFIENNRQKLIRPKY